MLKMREPMRVVTLEEHFVVPLLIQSPGEQDRAKIASGNADRLLRLTQTPSERR
jgi:hypothetical protein